MKVMISTGGLSDEQINNIAYEGEKGYHGTPSGIDNTASTFGGLIWFQKSDAPVVEKISVQNPIEIVMGNTGKVANTAAAVAGVKERKEKNSEKYNEIFARAENVAFLARQAFQDEDYDEVGKLTKSFNKMVSNLQEVVTSAKAVAEGDLSKKLDLEGDLSNAFNVSSMGIL